MCGESRPIFGYLHVLYLHQNPIWQNPITLNLIDYFRGASPLAIYSCTVWPVQINKQPRDRSKSSLIARSPFLKKYQMAYHAIS